MTSTNSTVAPVAPGTDSNPKPPGAYYYATTRMPRQTGFALIHGTHEGIVGDEDLPPIPDPDADYPTLTAWWRDVHAVLEDREVLASYRRHLVMDARPASCPAWCFGEHPEIRPATEDCLHQAPLAEVTLPASGERKAAETFRLSLSASEYEPGVLSQPTIEGGPDLAGAGLSPTDALEVGQALITAARQAALLLGEDLGR